MDENISNEVQREKRIPRMRTVDGIVQELKRLDPASEVSAYCIRQLVKNGALRSLPTGKKKLINLNDVLDLMNIGVSPVTEPEKPLPVGIRRVEV